MAFSSKVQQIATDGSPAPPCYELSWQDNSGGALPCYCARDCGVGEAAIVEFTSNWKCNAVGGRSRAGFGALRNQDGKGVAVVVENDGGWKLSIGTANTWAQYGGMTATQAIAAGLAANAWFRMHIKCTVNKDLTVTVVATVRTTADIDLGTLTATVSAERGDFFGFYGTFDQLGGTSFAWFDNLHVSASGSTNYVAQNTATSYVYTFVNDLGEESPPSPPSDTVLRPDGVSVTVTMPTTTPVAGDAATYAITGKRLYRAVTGGSGTVFLLVPPVVVLEPFGTGDGATLAFQLLASGVAVTHVGAAPRIYKAGVLQTLTTHYTVSATGLVTFTAAPAAAAALTWSGSYSDGNSEGTFPLAIPSFVDTLDDSAIANNDVLESDEWDPPPADLQGILALPNGIMAGFRRNQLCLSAAGRPHAWPVRFRYPTDTDIVAIANIDNTVVIGTQSFLYTATGNTPDGYSMSKPGDPQACVSKRSMVFLPDVGGGSGAVAYASPDGWMICAGSAGQVRNVTEGIFTKRQWSALTPSSIIAAVHDGVLHFFCTGPTPDAGYALDTKQTGFGLIRLSYHASALHVDPLTDALYLVLDVNSEPTAAALPLASTAVVPSGLQVFQFDAGASDMVFRWRGRLNLSPYPLTLTIAQVRALNYTNLLVRFYGDGVLVYEKVLGTMREFVLPAFATYGSYELELIGTSTVRTAQAAEDVLELG